MNVLEFDDDAKNQATQFQKCATEKKVSHRCEDDQLF